MKLSQILTWLREVAPESSAIENDPVGLLVAPAQTQIVSVAVCLDAYLPVVNTAVARGDNLIVCHHPLIYNALKRIDGEEPISEAVLTLVRAGIGLYAMHTNWDRAEFGVNDTLAKLLGLNQVTVLADSGIAAIAKIGSLPAPLSIEAAHEHIASTLECRRTSTLRYFPSRSGRPIQRIAVCGGAGGSLISDAVAAGADCLVTSDVRHHEFIEAHGRDLTIFDAGHAATEEPGMRSLAKGLADHFPGLDVHFIGL